MGLMHLIFMLKQGKARKLFDLNGHKDIMPTNLKP